MIEGGVAVTGEYQPENDMELLQIVWAIALLREKTPPERWGKMRDRLVRSVNRSQGKTLT